MSQSKQESPGFQTGLNLGATIARAAKSYRDHTATVFGERSRSWGEVYDRASRAASGLKELGVLPGDRVAILGLNSDNYLELYYAIWLADAVASPMNARWSHEENKYALNDCGAKVLFADQSFFEQAQALQDETAIESVLMLIGEPEADEPSYEGLISAHKPTGPMQRGGEDLAAIFYTGGTTGFPKGVMLSHAGLVISNLGFAPYARIAGGKVMFHGAPFFHMAAGAMVITTTMFAGTHVIMEKFDPDDANRLMIEHGVTTAMLVPAMIGMMIDHARKTGQKMQSLESLIYGASPMPEPVLKGAMEIYPDTRFLQAYGQTELSPFATLLEHEDHILEGPKASRAKSAGKPVIVCDVEVTDENGVPVPVGEVGEIRVRGPNVFLGYLNKPEETAKTLVDGWCLTGDAGRFDEDGFLYLVDRLKDMIVTGAENVYSAEVENAVLKHDAVEECAVIGIPHNKWGEQVHVVVALKPGRELEFEKLKEHCQQLIADYKCPRSMSISEEPLPRSPLGKILKRDIRAPFWDNQERMVN